MGNQKMTSTHVNIQEWVSLYADDLFRWALHKTGVKESAEDLVQDTFLAAFNSFDKFQGKSQPKTWLFSIMNNKVIDFHRKKFKEASKVHPNSLNNHTEGDVLNEFFDTTDTWKSNAKPSNWNQLDGHLLDNHEFNTVFEECMKNLSPSWYSAIHFKYLDQKNGNEICQELGITSSNYWKMLQRAKLQLRACIEKGWFKEL